MDKELKATRENQLYAAVLKSFQKAQEPGQLDGCKLILGKKIKKVNLKVPLAFIIGNI